MLLTYVIGQRGYFMNTLRTTKSIPLTPDRKKLMDEIRMLNNKEEKWCEVDHKKIREEYNEKILDHELYKRAEAAGISKNGLEVIRNQLGIQIDDPYEELERELLIKYISRKLDEQ